MMKEKWNINDWKKIARRDPKLVLKLKENNYFGSTLISHFI